MCVCVFVYTAVNGIGALDCILSTEQASKCDSFLFILTTQKTLNSRLLMHPVGLNRTIRNVYIEEGCNWVLFSNCSDFRYESNGIFVLGVGFFFLQTNFDFLTSLF